MTDGETLAGRLPVESESAAPGLSPVASLHAGLADELRRFILGVVRDAELADDVIQATYLKAIEHGHETRPETARGWLFRVAFHEAMAARRRSATGERATRKFADLRPRSVAGPDDVLIRGEAIEAVRKALGELPDEQRRVVLARVYEEKTFAEIAGEFGLPLGTVLTRMRRGLEKMRRSMRPGG